MAIEEVQARLARVTKVLNQAEIPYAIIGGNAVAEWVGRIDKAAVRFTKDVDILVRRSDLPAIIDVMQAAGFIHHRAMNVEMFLDGPDASPRDAVHLIFANEKVRSSDVAPAPDVAESETTREFSVLSLEALVRVKLTAYQLTDRVHLRDMLEVELIDASWCERLPEQLASRLQALIDDPDG